MLASTASMLTDTTSMRADIASMQAGSAAILAEIAAMRAGTDRMLAELEEHAQVHEGVRALVRRIAFGRGVFHLCFWQCVEVC